jgi:hypothetical protein
MDVFVWYLLLQASNTPSEILTYYVRIQSQFASDLRLQFTTELS